MRRIALLSVLVLALLAAPLVADDPPEVEVSKSAAEALARADPLLKEAGRSLEAKDWDDAVTRFAKVIAALGDEPVLAGHRDQALYNTACAQARLGQAAKAAETFALSVKNGLRAVLVRGPAGSWGFVPGLTFEHVLVDADLDPIRKEAAYLDALKPYLAAGDPVVEFTRPDTNSLVPAIVVLAADDADAERTLPAWRVAAKGRRVALVALAGPVRPTPTISRWLLVDGDDRWAVAKIKETLDLVAKDVHVDSKRIFLVGVGASPGEAAWAGAMSESKRLAGFAAPGARFHAEWHADAIAALPTTCRVALSAADEKPAQLLKDRGIEAARVAPSKDESEVAAAILDAMLGKR